MSNEEIDQLFSKQFFRKEDTTGQEGTGLGLTLSQELLEKIGSRLIIESHPGEGSRFSFQIQAATIPTPPHVDQ